jgi:hypothetical protein
MSNKDIMQFNLELDPFQYFGVPITSLYIEGVNWEEVNLEKGNWGEGHFSTQNGLIVRYIKKNLKISAITLIAEGYQPLLGFKTYMGKLPQGITLLMPRNEVLSRLGKPTSSSIYSYFPEDTSRSIHVNHTIYSYLVKPLPDCINYHRDRYGFEDGFFELIYSNDDIKNLYEIFIFVNGLKLSREEKLNICYPHQLKQLGKMEILLSHIFRKIK